MVATLPSIVNVVNLVNVVNGPKIIGRPRVFTDLFSICRDEVIFSSIYFVIVYIMT